MISPRCLVQLQGEMLNRWLNLELRGEAHAAVTQSRQLSADCRNIGQEGIISSDWRD